MVLNQEQVLTLTLFTETLFYGIFCVAVAVVMYILATDKRLSLSRKFLFSVAILQFLLTTIHMALQLYGVYVQGGSIHAVKARDVLAMVTGFLGNLILIWRVWMVWARHWWIVVLPLATNLTSFVIGIIGAAVLTSPNQLNNLLPIPSAFMAVAGTSINTFLIAGRLIYQQWKTNSVLETTGSHSRNNFYLRGIILLVLESGAVLVSSNIIALVLEEMNNTAEHIVLAAIMPLLGLVPTIMIILVHLNLAVGSHTSKRYTETLSALRFGENPKRRQNRTLDFTITDSDLLSASERSEEKATIKIQRDEGPSSESIEVEENTRFESKPRELLHSASSSSMA